MSKERPLATTDTLKAWLVHLYTALGLPIAVAATAALLDGDAPRFFLWSALACFVDATDGFFARKFRVKEVLPEFSGRRLDDIIDYLHFVVLPLAALPALGLLSMSDAWIVTIPLMASAYGFCQEKAKTDDAFVGFPSYWNILTLYLYVLGAGPSTIIASLVILSVLVFVPIHYLYPSRTPFLQGWTVGLGSLWALMLLAILFAPDASWAYPTAVISLFYPVYYTVVSLIHHRRVMATT